VPCTFESESAVLNMPSFTIVSLGRDSGNFNWTSEVANNQSTDTNGPRAPLGIWKAATGGMRHKCHLDLTVDQDFRNRICLSVPAETELLSGSDLASSATISCPGKKLREVLITEVHLWRENPST